MAAAEDNRTRSGRISQKWLLPLLQEFETPFQVPPFDKIKAEHYLPAMKEAM